MEITMEQEIGKANPNVINHVPITFGSAQDMYYYLRNEGDLYNTTNQIYVFDYSGAGAIAVFNIDEEEAKELSKESTEADDYWSSFLGLGGRIYDVPGEFGEDNRAKEFCEEHYNLEWYDTKDYAALVLESERNKKEWLESQIGSGILDALGDETYDFYYRAMHDYGMDFADVDRYAWLNTLFGYDIGAEKANAINTWIYEHDDEVLELGAESKDKIQNIATKLGFTFDYSKWVKETPEAMRVDW